MNIKKEWVGTVEFIDKEFDKSLGDGISAISLVLGLFVVAPIVCFLLLWFVPMFFLCLIFPILIWFGTIIYFGMKHEDRKQKKKKKGVKG